MSLSQCHMKQRSAAERTPTEQTVCAQVPCMHAHLKERKRQRLHGHRTIASSDRISIQLTALFVAATAPSMVRQLGTQTCRVSDEASDEAYVRRVDSLQTAKAQTFSGASEWHGRRGREDAKPQNKTQTKDKGLRPVAKRANRTQGARRLDPKTPASTSVPTPVARRRQSPEAILEARRQAGAGKVSRAPFYSR